MEITLQSIMSDAAARSSLWWARGDSNSQGLLHTLLRRTRIPIPPRARINLPCANNYSAILAKMEALGGQIKDRRTYVRRSVRLLFVLFQFLWHHPLRSDFILQVQP